MTRSGTPSPGRPAERASGRPVMLVGAGPGDPDLLTVKALRLIKAADVIVYDKLVSDAILDLVPAGTTRIFAGKQARNHHMPQEDINSLLVRLAKAGHSVVRLKGGDPFIFGRGGEEALHLAEHGIPFEVVPGITASVGCTAYAGIPLTHREHAQSVRFITGHLAGEHALGEGDAFDLDWRSLADPKTTLVVYMALTNLDRICERLVAHGLDAATPAAVINMGTRPDQKTVTATLATLPAQVETERLTGASLVVIGGVVGLAGALAWFQAHTTAPEAETAPRIS